MGVGSPPDDEDLLRPYKERLAREQAEDKTESVQAENEKGQVRPAESDR